jgi:PPP family 3-phenylpropionic acid transporter
MMILVTSFIYGSHAMHDAFAVIWWSDAGMDPSAISILWSEAVAAEVIVFFRDRCGRSLSHGHRGEGRRR